MIKRPLLSGKVNFPLSLAPMVGLSHVALRQVIRGYLPEGLKTVWPTEMLNSRKIPREDLSRVPETARAPEEDGLVPQILGNEESFIAESVQKLTDWGAEAVDINMGCPVAKALRHNYGVALMGDPDYAAEVVAMTRRNARIPVSVKLRAGLQNDFRFLVNFVQGLESAGADWVTLHPRTAEQKRRGRADWSQIRELRREVRLPVLGNGDVQTSEDVLRMLEETQCDGVVVGRALAARPWLVLQVAEDLNLAARGSGGGAADGEAQIKAPPRRAPRSPEEEGAEFGKSLIQWLNVAHEFFPPDLLLRKFRFHVKTASPWLEFGHTLMAGCFKAQNESELRQWIEVFFNQEQRMFPHTELRD